MVQRLALHYVPGETFLHRWDPRCKLLGLPAIAAFSLTRDPIQLVIVSFTLAALAGAARLPPGLLLRPLRGWLWLLALVLVVQAYTAPEPGASMVSRLPVTAASLESAAITIWRLVLMLLFGILFTAVTRPAELRDALVRLLRPLPLVPEWRIALMAVLTLRLFTLVLDLAYEVRLANRARLADLSRSPVRRMRALVLPLARRALIRADDLALALAARGYREDLYLPPAPVAVADWLPLVVYAALMIGWRFWDLPAIDDLIHAGLRWAALICPGCF